MTVEQQAQRPTDPDPPARGRMTVPPSSIIWAVTIAITGLIIYLSRELVLLLTLSAGLAYLLNPLVRMAESMAIKREVAVTGLFLALITGLFVTAYFLVPRLRAEITALSGGSP